MNIWKSRRFAAVFAAIIILLTLFFGGGRSLAAARARVLTADSSYTQDVTDLRAVAANLCTVAERYPEIDAGDGSVSALRRLLKEEPENLTAIREAFDTVMTLAKQTISANSEDATYLIGFQADYLAKCDILKRSEYAQQARNFNETLAHSFPASILSRLFDIGQLETFE